VPSPPRTGGAAEIRRWLKDQACMELDDQGVVTMPSAVD
jgi:hypothetical protein